MKNDQCIYTDSKVDQLEKDIYSKIADRLRVLDNLPNKKEFVWLSDFMIFSESFRVLRDQVDRTSTALLAGYKTEANIVLKSKIDRKEFE